MAAQLGHPRAVDEQVTSSAKKISQEVNRPLPVYIITVQRSDLKEFLAIVSNGSPHLSNNIKDQIILALAK